ncbi:hypothetical protein D9M68_882300 [compost metagenome]
MPPQVLLQPLLGGYVEHQALAAVSTAAGVLRVRWHHREGLANDLATHAGNFDIQLSAQAEHQLRMGVAVAEQFMAVVTQ